MRAAAKRGLFGLRRSTTVILAALVLLAVSAGAATGTVLSGTIDGSVPITVSQALIAQRPAPQDFPPNRDFFGSTSADGSKFSYALEMYRGEELTVLVPVVNRSARDTVAELQLVIPDIPSLSEGVPGLTISIRGSGHIDDVVRISPNKWTFTAKGGMLGLDGTHPDGPDGLLVTFKVAQTAMSGFFELEGRVRAREF